MPLGEVSFRRAKTLYHATEMHGYGQPISVSALEQGTPLGGGLYLSAPQQIKA